MTWIDTLAKQRPCSDGLEWAKEYKSFKLAWADCQRGDWMLWFLGRHCKTVNQRKRLVYTACQCARLTSPYIDNGELRPLKAVETAEAWTRGEATLDQVEGSVGCANLYIASWGSPLAAANSMIDAAWAACTKYLPSTLMQVAEYAGYAVEHDRKEDEMLSQCADIVRKNHPTGRL
jgi:hypothetical protein